MYIHITSTWAVYYLDKTLKREGGDYRHRNEK